MTSLRMTAPWPRRTPSPSCAPSSTTTLWPKSQPDPILAPGEMKPLLIKTPHDSGRLSARLERTRLAASRTLSTDSACRTSVSGVWPVLMQSRKVHALELERSSMSMSGTVVLPEVKPHAFLVFDCTRNGRVYLLVEDAKAYPLFPCRRRPPSSRCRLSSACAPFVGRASSRGRCPSDRLRSRQ